MTATYLLLARRVAGRGALTTVVLAQLSFLGLGALVRSSADAPLLDGLTLVGDLGLALLVPLVALVGAHLGLGRWVDERTAVLLWTRPVSRLRLAIAAWGVTATVVVAAAAVPVALAAAATGVPGLFGAAVTVGVPVACAYAAAFTWASGHGRNALLWCAGYILIWEGFVARASVPARWLSIRAHATTLLGDQLGVRLDGAVGSPGASAAIVVAVAVGATALLWLRMARRGFA